MLLAALFITVKRWKQTKCLLTDKWINTYDIHAMKLFAHTKELVIHVKTWMNLKDIMLIEKSQTPNTTYDSIHMKF